MDGARSGEVALDLAARHTPDAVILDLGLPDISGYEVIRGLRGWTDTPIIVVSARDATTEKVAALQAGADDYVTKPFAIAELLARVDAIIHGRELDVVETPDFVLDLRNRRGTNHGGVVHLTRY